MSRRSTFSQMIHGEIIGGADGHMMFERKA
jgi:hypothetical protein